MKSLNAKRLRLLKRIADNQQNGDFPLVRELAQSLGYRGESSITRMLDALVTEGYLQKHGGGQQRLDRIYRVTPKALNLLSPPPGSPQPRSAIPILGSIPAGPLGEAIQECHEFVEAGDILRVHNGDFFLRVTGRSMTGDGILPGDLVLLRPGVQVNNGEIAAVQIHGTTRTEATLKHVHWQPGKQLVRLRASNPRYGETRVPMADVNIVGAYRGLLRRPD